MTEIATNACVRYAPDGVPDVEASLRLTGHSRIRCHIYPEHAPILSVTDAHVSVSVSVPEPAHVTDQDVAVARELARAVARYVAELERCAAAHPDSTADPGAPAGRAA
jgi:hypothetical protein